MYDRGLRGTLRTKLTLKLYITCPGCEAAGLERLQSGSHPGVRGPRGGGFGEKAFKIRTT